MSGKRRNIALSVSFLRHNYSNDRYVFIEDFLFRKIVEICQEKFRKILDSAIFHSFVKLQGYE